MRRTKTMWLGSMVLMGLLAPSLVRADIDPEAEMKAINAHFQAQIQEARDKKITPNIEALRKEGIDKAKEDVKGVDPTKVDPAKGMAWGQLFSVAGEPKNMALAAEHFLTSNPTPERKFQAQMMMLNGYDESSDANGILKVLKDIKPTTPVMAAAAASTTANVIGTVAEKKGAKTALALLQQAEAHVPFDQLKTPDELQMADSVLLDIAGARADILQKEGKRDEALAALETGKAHQSPNSPLMPVFTAKTTAIKIVGGPAPVLKRERGYGEFASLDAYKGKVVVLDFMAHWCGPCKAAFPDMKKMYDELHSKGLEVVSVTSFYGSFGQEEKLTPDAEFAKMEGFVAKYNLTWPVIFGDKSNPESYGVSVIPCFVVIDQSGKVNSVQVGYNPELHAKLRKTVEDLLNKKVALR